ncbi:hypothetical protein [Acinetobacter venetianus]|uniref:hypothetical protein n=1 Tax=Acinetobacter venetianus TaxID=52133 RepID=UPI003A8DFD86
MSLQDLFPNVTKRDEVRAAKKRRKHNSKYRKWALSKLKKGYPLLCGTNTFCLDCGSITDNIRLGCSCWRPENKDSKGVIYGVNQVVELGNGIKTPLVMKSNFLSMEELRLRIDNNEEFYDISNMEKIIFDII